MTTTNVAPNLNLLVANLLSTAPLPLPLANADVSITTFHGRGNATRAILSDNVTTLQARSMPAWDTILALDNSLAPLAIDLASKVDTTVFEASTMSLEANQTSMATMISALTTQLNLLQIKHDAMASILLTLQAASAPRTISVLTIERKIVSTTGTEFTYTSHNDMECPVGSTPVLVSAQPSNRVAASALQKLHLAEVSTEIDRVNFGKDWFRFTLELLNAETDLPMKQFAMTNYSDFHLRMSKPAFTVLENTVRGWLKHKFNIDPSEGLVFTTQVMADYFYHLQHQQAATPHIDLNQFLKQFNAKLPAGFKDSDGKFLITSDFYAAAANIIGLLKGLVVDCDIKFLDGTDNKNAQKVISTLCTYFSPLCRQIYHLKTSDNSTLFYDINAFYNELPHVMQQAYTHQALQSTLPKPMPTDVAKESKDVKHKRKRDNDVVDSPFQKKPYNKVPSTDSAASSAKKPPSYTPTTELQKRYFHVDCVKWKKYPTEPIWIDHKGKVVAQFDQTRRFEIINMDDNKREAFVTAFYKKKTWAPVSLPVAPVKAPLTG